VPVKLGCTGGHDWRFNPNGLPVAPTGTGGFKALQIIQAESEGKTQPKGLDSSASEDGVHGMASIATVVKRSKRGAKWLKFPRA
jgi:hypothetical protein